MVIAAQDIPAKNPFEADCKPSGCGRRWEQGERQERRGSGEPPGCFPAAPPAGIKKEQDGMTALAITAL